MSMRSDMRNAESAYLLGQARFKTWLQKFMDNWTKPAQDQAVLTMWNNMPEQAKEELRRQMPEKVQEIEDKLSKLREV